jgi:hypothetical protein
MAQQTLRTTFMGTIVQGLKWINTILICYFEATSRQCAFSCLKDE